MIFLESQLYGNNLIIKEYAGFPKYLPLPCHLEHGWTCYERALATDLAVNKPLMLVFNKNRAKFWEKESSIPAYVMGAPFVQYRKLRRIKRKKHARGIVVFPSHSTFDIKAEFGVREYCEELKSLPKEYWPITVCLFYLDYVDPKADIYRNAGFRVVTAGPKFTNSLNFVRNFYRILSAHRFATSNAVGSYAFYAIDLGIPFFLTGTKPKLVNKGGDINLQQAYAKKQSSLLVEAIKLFSTGPVMQVSKKQKEFTRMQMGVGDCLSPKKLNTYLWQAFRKNRYWLRMVLPFWVLSIAYAPIFNAPWTGYFIKIRSRGSKS